MLHENHCVETLHEVSLPTAPRDRATIEPGGWRRSDESFAEMEIGTSLVSDPKGVTGSGDRTGGDFTWLLLSNC